MRSAGSRALCGLIRQVALASPSPIGITGAVPTHPGHSAAIRSTILASWLHSWLRGPVPLAPISRVPGDGLAPLAARALCTRSAAPPDNDPAMRSNSNATINHHHNNNNTNTNTACDIDDPIGSTSGASAGHAASAAAHTGGRPHATRSKSARHHHARPPAGPPPPPSRGAKDKAAKVPSPKAAAAMAAAKAGGQQPLTREARLQLDAQLAEMPIVTSPGPYRGRSTEGWRAVNVTGFYIGHSFTRASAEAVAARFRSQPLSRGVSVAGEYYDHEDALIILHQVHVSPLTGHAPLPACARAAAAEPLPAPASEAAAAGEGETGGAGVAGQHAMDPSAAAASTPNPPASPSLSIPEAHEVVPSGSPAVAGSKAGAVAAPLEVVVGTGGGQATASGQVAAAAGAPRPGIGLGEGTAPGPAAEWSWEAGAGTGPSDPADRVAEGTEHSSSGGIHAGDGSSSNSSNTKQDTVCMAVMLLEYGGVVFFNMPEALHSEALARVAAAALSYDSLPAGGAAPSHPQVYPHPVHHHSLMSLQLPPLRPGGGRAEVAGWRQAVADKLSLHKEEQLIVVDPTMMAGRGTGRWIRKLDDSLRIWAWDSTNLESVARVLSQSAAIRFYNQECEDMLERYETIMPLGYEPSERRGPLERLLFWRSRLPLRDLRQMVFKSSGIRVRLDSRLGLRDPPSGTWESTRHHAVWEAMRREFELDDRRDTLMEKTDLLKQSCLDLISANNESFTKRSELSIIVLITMEIIITLTDMHSLLSPANVGRAVGWAVGCLGLGLEPGDAAAVAAAAARDVGA